jgi:CubicO group peptidase (beta-lactamase class C family)
LPAVAGGCRPDGARPVRRREHADIDAPISGICSPDLASVAEEFHRNFAERGEVGAACCVIRDGEVVVDLWGGWTDAERTAPWQADTIVDVYSCGKAIAATLVLRSLGRAGLSVDTPVVEIWPEFGAAGKEWVTVRHALSHRAAVPAIRERLSADDLFDWSAMTAALAATEPWWREGERHAYHTNTFGHLTGEIVRRITGQMPGDVLRPIADALDADVWFGVPEGEQRRCADVIWDPPRRELPDPWSVTGDVQMNLLASLNPPGYSSIGVVNTPRWRALGLPSTGGHGSARGLARFYAGLLDDGRVLPRPVLDEATRPQSVGPCPILADDVTFGLGFTPTTERRPFGTNRRSFGHFGTGGAVGFADPDARIAFGYVMNHVIPRWQSTRNRALIDSLYSCLSAPADRR